jgi:hypothetical protein
MLATLILGLLLVTAALVVVLIKQSRKERADVKKSVVDHLLALISKRNLDVNSLTRLAKEAQLSPSEKKEVAVRTYATCFRCSFDQPELKTQLADIRSNLRLTAGDRDYAEGPVKIEKYSHTWSNVAGTGLPSTAGIASLLAFQRENGIAPKCAASVFGSRSHDLYRAAYRKWLSREVDSNYLNGLRTALGLDESDAHQATLADAMAYYRAVYLSTINAPSGIDWSKLHRIRSSLRLDDQTAAQAVKRDAISHVERQCDVVLNSGAISVSDRDRLAQLLVAFDLDTTDLSGRWPRIERLFQLQGLRDGNLPKLDVRIALRAGEICHFRDVCTFSWKSHKGEWRSTAGDLFVSNQRILFASDEPAKSFELKLSSIVDVDCGARSTDGLQIRCTANRGTGSYSVSDIEILHATLTGVLRNDHSPALRSRTIPSFVKQQVWARDKGKCVLCGCAEDLHYDHELPFSKGGSNTVENIRLLCVRCNLKKRDRIE